MSRSKSSGRWLKEHFDDVYVVKSKKEGYRSRASYKLLEIQEKDRLLKLGMTVVDLGASPGGWSQVARQFVGKNGKIVAVDRLFMDNLKGVEFIQGDFTETSTLEKLLKITDFRQTDLVISDMAPNISGIRSVDQAGAMYLAELTLDFAKQVLRPGGSMVVKMFQGSGFDHFIRSVSGCFRKTVHRKPMASRGRSREQYLVCKDFFIQKNQ